MDGHPFLICLVAAVSYCSSAPDPLDTLNININLEGSQTSTIPPTPPPPIDCTCGIKNPRIDQPTTRIYGGNNTGIFEYPWMVSLKRWNFGTKKYYHICGGVLVASQWVLTAAHCIDQFLPLRLMVYLGEHDQTLADETDKTIKFKPHKIIKHPDHTEHNQTNVDIALIKLDGYADLNIYTPACLSEVNQFFPGIVGTVTGWGRIKQRDDFFFIPVTQLQWIHAIVGSDEYCQEHDPRGPDYSTESITCSSQLGIIGKGECYGDSGGPLTVPYFGRHYLVGLVHGQAWTGHPPWTCADGSIEIYTSVAKLRSWIDKTIEENGGATYCTPTPFPFDRDEK